MIRINLLPPSARRRRRRQGGRDRLMLPLMSLGWAALLSAGYLWIAATEAEIVELRAQKAALDQQRQDILRSFDETALVVRERALQAERRALAQLQGGRRTPAPLLAELAEIVGAAGPDAPLDSPFTARGPLWLTELRDLGGGQWLMAASAADLRDLTGLLRRLQASERLATARLEEYARDDTGRLALRITFAVRGDDPPNGRQ
jgi:hypothetical protein